MHCVFITWDFNFPKHHSRANVDKVIKRTSSIRSLVHLPQCCLCWLATSLQSFTDLSLSGNAGDWRWAKHVIFHWTVAHPHLPKKECTRKKFWRHPLFLEVATSSVARADRLRAHVDCIYLLTPSMVILVGKLPSSTDIQLEGKFALCRKH